MLLKESSPMKEKPAVRNAEATQERILEAALAEFSAYGIAGARVDRIAKTAKCNKNLIYIYFEDKENLFATVLHKHLLRIHEEYPFTPDDLPAYAAKVFDFAMSNPDLMRLMTWSALENAKASVERAKSLDMKVAALTKAQDAGHVGAVFSPDFLMIAIMSIATAWSAGSPYGPAVNPNIAERAATLRKSISEAVRLLAKADKKTRKLRTGKLR
jgi:AcrR family transcriptional regulator